MHQPFRTLADSAQAEIRERGSSFHALAAPVQSESEAKQLVLHREKAMFDASHHCSAWRLRDGVWRTNDAGEPSGSAGAPILAAIDGAALTDCAIVVTRYFGGTKLGVGGLIRAYGEAASRSLQQAPLRIGQPAVRARVTYPYENTGVVMRMIELAGAHEVVQGYSGNGRDGEVTFAVKSAEIEAVQAFLRDQSGGTLTMETLDVCVLYMDIRSSGRPA